MKKKVKKSRMPAGFIAMLTVFILDQSTKKSAEEKAAAGTLPAGGAGPLRFMLLRNKGAAMGLGEKRPGLILGISTALTAVITAWLAREEQAGSSPLRKTGLALVAGGALGNTADRLMQGEVTDFIRVRLPGGTYSRMVFNVADVAIGLGALILTLTSRASVPHPDRGSIGINDGTAPIALEWGRERRRYEDRKECGGTHRTYPADGPGALQ